MPTSKPLNPRDIFQELGDVAKEYDYKATKEEQLAIRACSLTKPLVQLTLGCGGAGLGWAITSLKPLRQYKASRLAFAVCTGLYGAEAARYNADMACVYTLAQLPTPLGGEVAEIVRKRDPANPYLQKTPKRLEGDPAARIATEAARLMRQQGGAAPGGAAMVTSSSSSASAPEERLQEEAPPDVWGDSFILDMPSMEQALPDSDPADAPSSSRKVRKRDRRRHHDDDQS